MENIQGKTPRKSGFVLKSPKIIVYKGRYCHSYIFIRPNETVAYDTVKRQLVFRAGAEEKYCMLCK